MKIKVLNNTKNELKIEIVGEGHTFCNALQNTLLKNSTVEFAGYNLAHPLIAEPTLYIRTKGRRKPETALMEAVKILEKEVEEIGKTFEDALKRGKTIS